MKRVKQVLKRIPGAPFIYHKLVAATLIWRPAEDVFTRIFAGNKWQGAESVSGKGSDLTQTRIVARELPRILRDFRVMSVLDVPCGDFHWMRHVQLGDVDYTGGDIVADLIRKNSEQYARPGIHFRRLDLLNGGLPRTDLIFCRDCLVHFSYRNIFSAFKSVCDSDSTYLLTTTFPERRSNHDIATGQWRALNLQLAPFNLPAPVRLLNEGCTEDGGRFADKSLALWRVADLRSSLAKHWTT